MYMYVELYNNYNDDATKQKVKIKINVEHFIITF